MSLKFIADSANQVSCHSFFQDKVTGYFNMTVINDIFLVNKSLENIVFKNVWDGFCKLILRVVKPLSVSQREKNTF